MSFYASIPCQQNEYRDIIGSHLDRVPARTGASPVFEEQGDLFFWTATLYEAVTIEFAALSKLAHIALHAQLLPQWRQALSACPTEMFKDVFVGGRARRMRALPYADAQRFMQQWRSAALEAVRREVREAHDALLAMERATGDDNVLLLDESDLDL
jgi:hypothetical protein